VLSGYSVSIKSELLFPLFVSVTQKALKEKEEHIEQLLRERDLERSEVARAAAQVDEAQCQLTQIKMEKERMQVNRCILMAYLTQRHLIAGQS